MKASDLLLTKEELDNNVYSYPEGSTLAEELLFALKATSNRASLKTAKAIRDEIVGFGKLCRVDYKHGVFISDELYHEIFSPIKEIEDSNITKESK